MLSLIAIATTSHSQPGARTLDTLHDDRIYNIFRELKVGERDTYAISADVRMKSGSLYHIKGEITQAVKKIVKLDAEITQLTSCVTTGEGTSERIEETNRKADVIFSKYGVITKAEVSKGSQFPLGDIMQYGLLTPLYGIKDKHTIAFDSRTAENPRNFFRGWVKLESINDTTAKVRSHIEYLTDETPTEVKVDNFVIWNWRISKPETITVDVSNLPKRDGEPQIEHIQLHGTRVIPK